MRNLDSVLLPSRFKATIILADASGSEALINAPLPPDSRNCPRF